MVDWDNLPESQVAAVCGRDPMMWAAAFCHAAKKIGGELGDDPEGFVVGWFSAAMQAETDYMTPEQHEHEAREQRRVKCLHQAAMKGAHSMSARNDCPNCDDISTELATIKHEISVAMEEYDAGEADAIERLRDENERLQAALRTAIATWNEATNEIERLRAALREIADAYAAPEDDENAVWMRDTARRALGRK